MSQADFCSLSDLWRIAKTHGMDWALQKLSEGPEENPQMGSAPPTKMAEEGLARYRDASPAPGPSSRMQLKTAAGVQGESTSQLSAPGPRSQLPGGPMGDTSVGEKEIPYLLWPQTNASPGRGWAPEAVQSQVRADTHQPLPAVQSTADRFPRPTPVLVVGQVGEAQASIQKNSVGEQVSVASQLWVPPLVIPPSFPSIPVQAVLSTSPLFLGSTVPTLAPLAAIAWHVTAET
ncbi:hypothetical protein NDU88_003609 [Pleurodeles waltl]|uniref:Uncharacterized protein n=1 Tax=Pleurodeles waltl TaxID=8319 RepID=A0AAV7TPM3_PLEWA|nr:hypothetical protein NDU88_003609 [Pleurodeles waltl]